MYVNRCMFKIGLLLLLGAIISIGVAWGFGAKAEQPTGSSQQTLSAEEFQRIWDANFSHAHETYYFGWRDTRWFTTALLIGDELMGDPHISRRGVQNQLLMIDSGWPCRMMRHIQTWDSSTLGQPRPLPMRWLSESSWLWRGFAINTLFYAAILWLLFMAPFALRRWRRIRRGLCPACAYRIGDSAVCTECGKPVKPRTVQHVA